MKIKVKPNIDIDCESEEEFRAAIGKEIINLPGRPLISVGGKLSGGEKLSQAIYVVEGQIVRVTIGPERKAKRFSPRIKKQ